MSEHFISHAMVWARLEREAPHMLDLFRTFSSLIRAAAWKFLRDDGFNMDRYELLEADDRLGWYLVRKMALPLPVDS